MGVLLTLALVTFLLGFGQGCISSSSSSSGSSHEANGGAWQGRIFYIDNMNWPNEIFNGNEMRYKVNLYEEIINVWYYKSPLWSFQSTDDKLHHAYVIVETKSFYFSIEKYSDGIWIQKSRDGRVFEEYKGSKRKDRTLLHHKTTSGCTLQSVIKRIETTELDKTYIAYRKCDNCQGFADRIYDRPCLNYIYYHLGI